jgi:hypothetical protein
MKQELDNLLCERYPEIFAERNLDMTETCMCWGFECGDGWFDILDRLCATIQHHIDWRNRQRADLLENNPHNLPIPEEIPQVVAEQVKEKFGTLRFYYRGGDDYVSGLVSMAEAITEFTCETCGDRGEANESGWISVRCDKHRKAAF